jgi:hypothetical protein
MSSLAPDGVETYPSLRYLSGRTKATQRQYGLAKALRIKNGQKRQA